MLTTKTLAWAAALLVVAGAGLRAGEEAAKPAGGATLVSPWAKNAKWLKHQVPGVEFLPVSGDMEVGAHACYARFAPGSDHGWHTHTADITVMGVKGTYLYKDATRSLHIGPGTVLVIPGGTKHWSGCPKTKGCIIYQSAPAKFDLIKAEAPPAPPPAEKTEKAATPATH